MENESNIILFSEKKTVLSSIRKVMNCSSILHNFLYVALLKSLRKQVFTEFYHFFSTLRHTSSKYLNESQRKNTTS